MEQKEFLLEEYNRWITARGDLTFRLNYELNRDSIVLDIGGYLGDWASNIFSKQEEIRCLEIYEPIKEYYEFIEKRFEHNRKIRAYNFGFSNERKDVSIIKIGESSSAYTDKIEPFILKEEVSFFSFKAHLRNYEKIDLAKFNVEGSEYEIFESLDRHDFLKLKNIQIQFHPFVDNHEQRKKSIRNILSYTHNLDWNFEGTWESWKLK